jgi:hypothetical protein
MDTMLGRVRRSSRRTHPDVIRLEETGGSTVRKTFHLHAPTAIATQSSAKETEIVTLIYNITQTHDFGYSVRIYYSRFRFTLTKPLLAYPRPLVVADDRIVKGPSPKAQA